MGAQRVVVLGAHPGDLLGQLVELRANLVGVAPGGVERTLEAQELLGVIAQRDRGLDLRAQLTHADLDLIELLAALGDALELALGLAHPRHHLFHPGHLALRRLAPLAQDVDLWRAIQHPAHGAELLQGGLGPGDQRLQGDGDVGAAGIDGDDGVVRFAAAFQEADHVVLRGGGAVNDEISRADEGGSATDVPIGALAYMRKEGLVEEGRNVVIGWEIRCGWWRAPSDREATRLGKTGPPNGDLPGLWQVAGAELGNRGGPGALAALGHHLPLPLPQGVAEPPHFAGWEESGEPGADRESERRRIPGPPCPPGDVGREPPGFPLPRLVIGTEDDEGREPLGVVDPVLLAADRHDYVPHRIAIGAGHVAHEAERAGQENDQDEAGGESAHRGWVRARNGPGRRPGGAEPPSERRPDRKMQLQAPPFAGGDVVDRSAGREGGEDVVRVAEVER